MTDITVGLLSPREPEIGAIFREALPSDWTLVVGDRGADDPGFADRLPEFDSLIVYGNRVERRHIERATRLRLIQKVGIGVDDLDVAACRERGLAIAICKVGGVDAVAEHALAITLAALKRLPELDRRVREKLEWDRWSLRPVIRQLAGSTVGIIGYGEIGNRTAALMRATGAKVRVYARRELGFTASEALRQVASLHELFDETSIVSLHVPLTTETRAMVNEKLLERLGPAGLLVNTARGAVVDENALYRVLADGRLGFAAIDVVMGEPPASNPLFSLPNILVTPHTAAGGYDVLRAKAAFIRGNLEDHFADRPLVDRIV